MSNNSELAVSCPAARNHQEHTNGYEEGVRKKLQDLGWYEVIWESLGRTALL